MSSAAAKTSRRMPWRLAVLVPTATFIVIWRGIPFVTPMLTFTWLTGLLAGGGLIAVGLYGPDLLAAAGRASKERAARQKLKAEKEKAKAEAKAKKTTAKK